MLTAQEAVAIADKAIEQYLAPIAEMIAARAGVGGRTYTNPFKPEDPIDLSAGAILKLEQAGFTVTEEDGQGDGLYTVIRW